MLAKCFGPARVKILIQVNSIIKIHLRVGLTLT